MNDVFECKFCLLIIYVQHTTFLLCNTAYYIYYFFLGKDLNGQSWYLVDCYHFLGTSLLKLSSNMRKSTGGSKLLLIAISLSGMFLFWSWESMLISYFFIPSRIFPFNSLEEFLAKTDKKVNLFK